jgi:ligand-binding sensor domain-containing protein
MPLPLLSNSYALLIAGLLAISSSVGQSENRDPYFTPTAAKSTSYMPRVIIRNMREDRAGNIWFATFGGAIRYDGKEFANFSEEVGLAKTRIFSLLEARSGALWFGSITGGASRYDGKSFKKFTEKEGLGNNDVMWIFEDRDANIWGSWGEVGGSDFTGAVGSPVIGGRLLG